MGKFTYPKCPYCHKEYHEMNWREPSVLSKLALNGWLEKSEVRCQYCKKKFKVKIHITYYSSKLKENE